MTSMQADHHTCILQNAAQKAIGILRKKVWLQCFDFCQMYASLNLEEYTVHYRLESINVTQTEKKEYVLLNTVGVASKKNVQK